VESYSNIQGMFVVKYRMELVRKAIVIESRTFLSKQNPAPLSVSCFLLFTFSFPTPICFKLKERSNLPLSQFRIQIYHVCKCMETTFVCGNGMWQTDCWLHSQFSSTQNEGRNCFVLLL